MTSRLVVGITGASGAIYGIRLLERLRELPVETHLIVSRWARVTIEHETDRSLAEVRALADVCYADDDQAAAVSSGSFLTRRMVIAPCSTKTVAAIANGFSHNLVSRAPDVVLKERRPLVLVVRETPLSAVHLRNMTRLSELGATDLPAGARVLQPARHARRRRRPHSAARARPTRLRARLPWALDGPGALTSVGHGYSSRLHPPGTVHDLGEPIWRNRPRRRVPSSRRLKRTGSRSRSSTAACDLGSGEFA